MSFIPSQLLSLTKWFTLVCSFLPLDSPSIYSTQIPEKNEGAWQGRKWVCGNHFPKVCSNNQWHFFWQPHNKVEWMYITMLPIGTTVGGLRFDSPRRQTNIAYSFMWLRPNPSYHSSKTEEWAEFESLVLVFVFCILRVCHMVSSLDECTCQISFFQFMVKQKVCKSAFVDSLQRQLKMRLSHKSIQIW